MKNKIISLIIVVLATASLANAQTTEIKITLDEQFFDALLDAVFTHLDEPSVPISELREKEKKRNVEMEKMASDASFANSFIQKANYSKTISNIESKNSSLSTLHSQTVCDESIKLKREIDGVKTAVRFINGKIFAPIAFSGNYNPPFVGCIEFQGWAEANIDLSFDKNKNALVGRAKVSKVNLSGTGGIGSTLLAGFVQNSIDSKINPIEIIKMDKLSFTTPVKDSGKLRMKALGIRHQVNNKTLDVYLKYKFEKG